MLAAAVANVGVQESPAAALVVCGRGRRKGTADFIRGTKCENASLAQARYGATEASSELVLPVPEGRRLQRALRLGNARLVAAEHVQHTNAAQVRESSASDARLGAVAHVQPADATQVRKGGVSDACAPSHDERAQALQVHKVGVHH